MLIIREMKNMVPITKKIDNDDHSEGNNILYIVVHDTGNFNDTAEKNANYFCTGSRQASAHYFVDEDSIVQIVEDNMASWHCGDGKNKYSIGNHNSLGIEMCKSNGLIAESTISNTLDLIRIKMKQYNVPIERVVRHYDASRKLCPSSMSANNWAKWDIFKSRLLKDTTPIVPPISIVNTTMKYGIVTASSLNVREKASVSSTVIGSLIAGSVVKIDKRYGDWYSIYFGNHGGYVSAKYIK
jgi:N-acetylmuramoyl-L-alanine amidase